MANAVISTSTSGATLVSAPAAGHRRVIEGIHFICTGAVVVTLLVGGVAVTGAMSFAANGGISSDDAGWDLAAGQALTVTLGGVVAIQGWINYTDYPVPG